MHLRVYTDPAFPLKFDRYEGGENLSVETDENGKGSLTVVLSLSNLSIAIYPKDGWTRVQRVLDDNELWPTTNEAYNQLIDGNTAPEQLVLPFAEVNNGMG